MYKLERERYTKYTKITRNLEITNINPELSVMSQFSNNL